MPLPKWETQQTDRGVGLTCPRCDGRLVVNLVKLKAMKQEAGVAAAMCPYCSKANAVPGLRSRAGVSPDEYLGS